VVLVVLVVLVVAAGSIPESKTRPSFPIPATVLPAVPDTMRLSMSILRQARILLWTKGSAILPRGLSA